MDCTVHGVTKSRTPLSDFHFQEETVEGIGYPLQEYWAPLVVQRIKNLPAMWKTWVQSLGWEDPLEKKMANHSSIFA